MPQRKLEEITGESFEEWLKAEGYFTESGTNSDLAHLDPVKVIKAFLAAINEGDKTRANACLSPKALLSTLTMNREPKCLYNPGFGPNNSLVENIISGRLLSWKFYDPKEPAKEAREIGDRQTIGVAAQMELRWREDAFNTPSGRTTRFFILSKSYLGWKIDGLGTGP